MTWTKLARASNFLLDHSLFYRNNGWPKRMDSKPLALPTNKKTLENQSAFFCSQQGFLLRFFFAIDAGFCTSSFTICGPYMVAEPEQDGGGDPKLVSWVKSCTYMYISYWHVEMAHLSEKEEMSRCVFE